MTPTLAPVAVDFPEKLEFLFEPHPFKIVYGGRGGIKSWNFAQALVILAAERPLRILCARETQRSIADSVHRLLADSIERLGLGEFFEIQQHAIIGRNGSEFRFAGLRQNIDNLKSYHDFDIFWIEEAQTVSKRSWEVLLPTLRKQGAEVWISFNPELETDPTYVQFVVNPPPGAVVVHTTWQDNPWLPENLRRLKDHLLATDPKAYENVWGGQCKAAVEGAIFSAEMQQAHDEGRITTVPVDRTKPVSTFWDLGFGDDTAIWFAQPCQGYYHCVDYLTAHGKTIDWYLVQLQQRGYVYGTHNLPHDGIDAIIHLRLGGGDRSRSIEMQMRAAGLTVRITPKLYVTDQINAARTILSQCRFDRDKCNEGIKALQNYQWAPPTIVNLPTGASSSVPKREPLHDWASHGASAFMNLAVTMKQTPAPAPPEPVSRPPKPASVWS